MRSPFGLSSVSWWDPEKKKKKTSLSSVAHICITSWKIHEKKSQRNKDCFKGTSWNRFPIYKGRLFFFRDFHAPLRIHHRQWHCCSTDNQQVSSTEMRLLLYWPWCQGSTICGCITLEKVDICSSLFIACSSLLLLYWRKKTGISETVVFSPYWPACYHYTCYHCVQYDSEVDAAVVIVRVRDGQIEWGIAIKK